jgi:hypothetical protein
MIPRNKPQTYLSSHTASWSVCYSSNDFIRWAFAETGEGGGVTPDRRQRARRAGACLCALTQFWIGN